VRYWIEFEPGLRYKYWAKVRKGWKYFNWEVGNTGFGNTREEAALDAKQKYYESKVKKPVTDEYASMEWNPDAN
jgi:hypothetical protein